MHLLALAHVLQVCIFILISTVASGHVLFAANVDDFHSLTKQFIPELADQLAGLVAKNKNTQHQPDEHFKPVLETEETDPDSVYKPSQESEEPLDTISKQAYLKPKERAIKIMGNKTSEENSASNVPEYTDATQKDEESKQYEENTYANDNAETETVEKTDSETEEMERDVGSRNPRTSVNKIVQQAIQQNKQERTRYEKKKKVRTVHVNLEQLVEKVKDRILRDLKPEIDKGLKKRPIINDNTKFTRMVQKPAEYAIKQNIIEKLRKKTLTTTEGNNNNWYEKDPELVSKAQKAGIGVGKTKIKQLINNNGKINMQRPRKPGQSQAKEYKNYEIMEEDDILTKVKLSSNKKKDSYEDYVAPKKELDIFESNEHETLTTLQEIRFKQRTQKDIILNTIRPIADENRLTLKTTTPEYEDYQQTNTEAELKARTENIGDYDDHKHDNTRITSQKTNNKLMTNVTEAVKKKDKKQKLGTMIPTREIYKMSSPNYYGKLPKIAERYKFDEPIPFKDMEDENLKPVGNPPANINGKVRV